MYTGLAGLGDFTAFNLSSAQFDKLANAGVNLNSIYDRLIALGASPQKIAGFGAWATNTFADAAGQLGKYAHGDTIDANLLRYLQTADINQADYRADAGRGGWLIHNLDTIFKVVNPLAPVTGRVDAAISRAIPIGGSFFRNLTAEAINPMTFLPGALPDPVTSAIATAYFNRRVQGKDPTAAFIGANIDAATGATIAAGGYAIATGVIPLTAGGALTATKIISPIASVISGALKKPSGSPIPTTAGNVPVPNSVPGSIPQMPGMSFNPLTQPPKGFNDSIGATLAQLTSSPLFVPIAIGGALLLVLAASGGSRKSSKHHARYK